MEKIIIYSVLPRLWGNKQKTLTENGSLEENGCGKLSAFGKEAFDYIKSLGCNYVWYVGLLEHSTTTAFQGIEADPQSIVKGRAGSPYSVKDYYDVAPALADEVGKRQQEFDALLQRTHEAGLGFMMDFIPNHVARTYHSDACPAGVRSFGADDDQTKAFDKDNNFYYFPNERLTLPTEADGYREYPARATGNDCFTPCPSRNDWFEAVKLNYGVDYLAGGQEHFETIPDTWQKMYDILSYWAGRGVDGFRCDMAEMVPTAFWSWCIARLKEQYPKLIFLAEIYQEHRYEAYLNAGFDYLYDKVGMYDTMRNIICGFEPAKAFDRAIQQCEGFRDKMCYFLENHDEQRLASDFFASKAEKGYPALTALALSGTNPFLLYFGQELGERAMEREGFSGLDGRTTIFDYWALDKLQRLEQAKYKGKYLDEAEQELLQKYQQVLSLANQEEVLREGAYYGLNYAQNQTITAEACLVYMRYTQNEYVLLVANFAEKEQNVSINFPKEFFIHTALGEHSVLTSSDLLAEDRTTYITTLTSLAPYNIEVEGLGVRVIKFNTIK